MQFGSDEAPNGRDRAVFTTGHGERTAVFPPSDGDSSAQGIATVATSASERHEVHTMAELIAALHVPDGQAAALRDCDDELAGQRVVIVTNRPTHYRVPLFNRLRRRLASRRRLALHPVHERPECQALDAPRVDGVRTHRPRHPRLRGGPAGDSARPRAQASADTPDAHPGRQPVACRGWAGCPFRAPARDSVRRVERRNRHAWDRPEPAPAQAAAMAPAPSDVRSRLWLQQWRVPAADHARPPLGLWAEHDACAGASTPPRVLRLDGRNAHRGAERCRSSASTCSLPRSSYYRTSTAG